MLKRIPYKRIAALAAALPALLSGAAQAQAAAPNVAPAQAAASSGKAGPKALVKIATYIKLCCVSLVSYNSKGEVLLQSPDGQNFVFNDAGQRVPYKLTAGDVPSSMNRVPLKGSTGDIPTDAAKAAPKKAVAHNVSERSADFYLKFTSAHNNIEVVGLTEQKQTVFKNQRGETFTIHPMTGDFILINLAKWL